MVKKASCLSLQERQPSADRMIQYRLSKFPLLIYCFILTNTRYAASLECYSCSNIEDINNCTHTVQCSVGHSCYQDTTTNGQSRIYTLGCIDKHQCGTHGGGASELVGRDLQERQTDHCHECCGTDDCNKHLCEHLKPTTCIDDVKIDCAFLNTVTNICEDIHHAKTICPRFCDLCSLVDGMWSEWTAWSTCDVTCENGTQTRTRTCSNPPPANGGLNCSGSATDVKDCHKQLCPVHGGWTKWSDWEACSVSCDTGIQKRHRNCTSPYPSRFGDHCFGDPVDDQLCMPGPCANGGWSQWSTWSSCSLSCGGGVRSQTRTCTNPRPSLTGKSCAGKDFQISSCNNNSCIPNIVFNVYNVTDQSPDIGQTMIFSIIVVNEGGAYNASTGVFTAPVEGTYSFSAQLCFTSGQSLFFDIKVGGRTYASKYGYSADSYICPLLQTAARVKKNEKVVVQWTTTSYRSNNYIIQNYYSRNFFSGMLVHL